MSEKQELIIFTGNIGSGKSLMASKLAKKGYVVVNNDAITTMVHGGEYGMYDHAKKEIYRGCELSIIHNSLALGMSVVVDRTGMAASDRKIYIAIGLGYGARIILYDWGPGSEEALKRRLDNPKGISKSQWESVHARMVESYECPSIIDEKFDEIWIAPTKYNYYAFDFDGTIVEHKFPDIGKEIPEITNKMRELWKSLNNIIIIWTCRSGDYLNQMKAFLIKQKIPFDFINENPLVDFGSPKIFAHEYYDDRNSTVYKGGGICAIN